LDNIDDGENVEPDLTHRNNGNQKNEIRKSKSSKDSHRSKRSKKEKKKVNSTVERNCLMTQL